MAVGRDAVALVGSSEANDDSKSSGIAVAVGRMLVSVLSRPVGTSVASVNREFRSETTLDGSPVADAAASTSDEISAPTTDVTG